MERFIKYLSEEFDQAPLVPLAMKWLKNKFVSSQNTMEFIHKPNLNDDGNKKYDVSVDGKHFSIVGRKHETEYSNPVNSIIFKIISSENEDENEESEDEF